VTLVLRDISYSLPLGIGRNVNRKIAAAEAVQLIGAFSDPRLLTQASPNFNQFTEPDGTFHGAYGVRIGHQLVSAINKIKHDSDTRQAVITLWDPSLDNSPFHRDYPCTTALGLALIDDKLCLRVVMRSQDVWLGSVFDWFQFTQLQWTAARILGVEPGEYTHTTWSTHLYASNLADVDRLTTPPDQERWEWQPRGIGSDDDGARATRARARALPYRDAFDWTKSERWYRDQLATLLG
jgi:hypothetical protein